MKESHSSIDGFIPRRAGNSIGEVISGSSGNNIIGFHERKIPEPDEPLMHHESKPQSGIGVKRSDIDESLRDIDGTKKPVKKPSRRQRRRLKKMAKKPKNKVKRLVKWIAIILIVIVLAGGGYVAYRFIAAGGNIFQGSIFDLFQSQALKTDSNGRSNFLILGTTEDDPGHPGSNLTDTMMVLSIDQKAKNAYMFSIPRDLYVQFGAACVSGYAGKINEYFSCTNDGTSSSAEQDRLTKTQKFVGDIFGLDIQYGVHVNQTVVKEAVDAVGGIDVNIEGDGAPGILDRNFDWRCNYKCFLVKYTNGVHRLDGTAAMYLTMARGDSSPTYGLAKSNFDREKNQQKIMIALKNKATSTGTVTNIGAVTKLIDTLGNNLRTNIQTKEIRTLMQVGGDIKPNDIHTLSLIDGDNAVVKTGSYGGMSVVMPSEGIFDYTGVQAFIHKNLSNNPVAKEAAPIVVLNGTGQTGYGQSKADSLTKDGFNVTGVKTAPDGTYENVEIYRIGTSDAATAKKLASMYNIKLKTTAPPIVVDNTVRFVIIYGSTTT
ncbi:MAG: LCP family protein [Candidatus Saccharibacteria bacterium]|nr:LCP family protein [Candidatus Saccharibacteria bacterium]